MCEGKSGRAEAGLGEIERVRASLGEFTQEFQGVGARASGVSPEVFEMISAKEPFSPQKSSIFSIYFCSRVVIPAIFPQESCRWGM